MSRKHVHEASDGSQATVIFKNRSHAVKLCVHADVADVVRESVDVAGEAVAFGEGQAALIEPPPHTEVTILRQRGAATNNDLVLGQSPQLTVKEIERPGLGPLYSVTYHP